MIRNIAFPLGGYKKDRKLSTKGINEFAFKNAFNKEMGL